MEYRQARIADLRQLAELRWQSRTDEDGEKPQHSRSDFVTACEQFLHQGLSTGSQAYWLAVENEEIVSHVVVQKVSMIPRPCKINDQWGYITNAYTLPQCRNRGIGRALFTHVIAWARAADLELLIVWPSHRAVSFYRRVGFDARNEVMQ